MTAARCCIARELPWSSMTAVIASQSFSESWCLLTWLFGLGSQELDIMSVVARECLAIVLLPSAMMTGKSLKLEWTWDADLIWLSWKFSQPSSFDSTVVSWYVDCIGYQEKCPYIKLSLLRSTTVVRMQCLAPSPLSLHQECPYVKCPYIKRLLYTLTHRWS